MVQLAAGAHHSDGTVDVAAVAPDYSVLQGAVPCTVGGCWERVWFTTPVPGGLAREGLAQWVGAGESSGSSVLMFDCCL